MKPAILIAMIFYYVALFALTSDALLGIIGATVAPQYGSQFGASDWILVALFLIPAVIGGAAMGLVSEV